MKTQKLAVTFLILLMIIGCTKENPKEKNPEKSKTSLSNEETMMAPGNLISLEKAKEQLDNYNEAHPLEVGSEYAVRTWISIEELKSYIAYIEKESAEKGIELSGIDFIHTQYKKAKPGSPNPNNADYDKTLMLAPTYAKGNSNVAFDPIYSENGNPKDLKILLDEIKTDSMNGKGAPSPGGSSIANSLNTCPNTCN